MRIKFCRRKADGCRAVAIGVSRWHPDERPEDRYCREHYLSDVMGEPVLAEVVGLSPITDSVSNESIERGEVVRLDPRQVNIAGLVYAGHVELIEPAPAAPAKSGKAAPKPDTDG